MMRMLAVPAATLLLASPALAQTSTTISIWTRLAEEAAKPMFDAFEAAHPEIDLEVEYIPGGKNHINKLIAAVAAGNAPDMVTLDVVATEAFARLDALKPLDEIMAANADIAAETFPAGPLATGNFEGVQYAIPFGGDASAIAYNKDIFEEAGLDPENPPQTWAEFTEAAKKLTFDRDGDGQKDVYAIQFVPSQPWLTTFYWLPYFWMAGGEVNDREAMQFTFNSEAGVRALSHLMDLHLVHGVVPPSAIGAQASADNQLEFLQGRVAMIFDGQAIIQRVNRDAPDFNLGIMPHPRPNAGDPLMSFAGGDNLAIMANIPDEELTAAIDVLKGLTSVENQRVWFDNSVWIPVREELLEDPFYQSHPLQLVYLQSYLGAHAPPQTSHYVEVQQYLRDAFEQVAYGMMDAKQALDDAKARADELVARTQRP
jgi:ABC-type glycerol-3-phosphate transport system substrate-binding protein